MAEYNKDLNTARVRTLSVKGREYQIELQTENYNSACLKFNRIRRKVKQALESQNVDKHQLELFVVELQSAYTVVKESFEKLLYHDPDYVKSASETEAHDDFLTLSDKLSYAIGNFTDFQDGLEGAGDTLSVNSVSIHSNFFDENFTTVKSTVFTGGSDRCMECEDHALSNELSLDSQAPLSIMQTTTTYSIAHSVACPITTPALTVSIFSTSVPKSYAGPVSLSDQNLHFSGESRFEVTPGKGYGATKSDVTADEVSLGKKSSSLPDFDMTRKQALKETSESFIYKQTGVNIEIDDAHRSEIYLSSLPQVDPAKLLTDSSYLTHSKNQNGSKPASRSNGKGRSLRSMGSRVSKSKSASSRRTHSSATSSVLIEAITQIAQKSQEHTDKMFKQSEKLVQQSREHTEKLVQESFEQNRGLMQENREQNKEFILSVLEQNEKQTKQLLSSVVTTLERSEKLRQDSQAQNMQLMAETQSKNSAFLSEIKEQHEKQMLDNDNFGKNLISTVTQTAKDRELLDLKDSTNEKLIIQSRQLFEEKSNQISNVLDHSKRHLADIQERQTHLDSVAGKFQNMVDSKTLEMQSMTTQLARQNEDHLEKVVRSIGNIVSRHDEEDQAFRSRVLHDIGKVSETCLGQKGSPSSTSGYFRPPPPLTPSVFKGDPAKYMSWRRDISYLMSLDIREEDKLAYLEQFLSDDLQKDLKVYLQDVDAASSAKVLSKLDERFGDRFLVVRLYIEQLENWPYIKNRDGESLRAFADFLSQIEAMASCSSHFDYLKEPKQVKILCDKLPEKLASKWIDIVGEYKEANRDHYPNFSSFVQFFSKCSKLANDPIYSEGRTPNPMKDNKSTVKRVNTHSTDISESKNCAGADAQEMATTVLEMAAEKLMKSALEVKSTFTTLVGKAVNNPPQQIPPGPIKPKYKCPYCEMDFHYVFQCAEFAKLSL